MAQDHGEGPSIALVVKDRRYYLFQELNRMIGSRRVDCIGSPHYSITKYSRKRVRGAMDAKDDAIADAVMQ